MMLSACCECFNRHRSYHQVQCIAAQCAPVGWTQAEAKAKVEAKKALAIDTAKADKVMDVAPRPTPSSKCPTKHYMHRPSWRLNFAWGGKKSLQIIRLLLATRFKIGVGFGGGGLKAYFNNNSQTGRP